MYGSKRARRALLCLAGLLIAATSASAQGWQETIGSTNAGGETGTAAVEAANGDMLVTGYAGDPFFIRTDAYGTVLWQTLYPMIGIRGGQATGIKEFPNGDIAIVGYVTDASNHEMILVMRLQSNGVPIWTMVLDNPRDMEAYGLVITNFGSGAAQPGDIVLCGLEYTPTMHGILARINGGGNLVWFRDYAINAPGAPNSGQLRGVDEAQIATGSNPGDIVAGGVQSGLTVGALPTSDIWVLRVDGNTGAAVGPGLGSATFGTGAQHNELGKAITELRYGAHPGDLVVTGGADSRPGTAALEVVMLQTPPDPTDPSSPRASSYIGDGGAVNEDWGNSICEIPPTIGAGSNIGNVVIAGHSENGAFGGTDAFIQEVQEGTMTTVGPMHYMGGKGYDDALSVAPVIHGPISNGYVIAGVTTSTNIMLPGHQQNVHLMKNYYTLANNCQSGTTPLSDAPAGLTATTNQIIETDLVAFAAITPIPISTVWTSRQLCDPDAKFMAPEAEPSSVDGAVSVAPHPSLVRRGDLFTLDCALATGGTVSITISDVAGRIVSQATLDREAGPFSQLIRTDGWSAGTYLARVSAGGHVATSRIVVIDR
jgi:hypothetical protein